MKEYDYIVVGSGISGLTMSLLLAMNSHKVLLLEKSPVIGGSLSRFTRKGIPFDTGFHFTGGLQHGGILDDILSFLGIRNAIEPIFLSDSSASQFIFEAHGKSFELPYGIDNIKQKLKSYFPDEADAIDRYMTMVQSVCSRTPSLNIRDNVIAASDLEEDYISLDAVLKDLTSNVLLRGLLSGYAMCYGVRPEEISFANHSRMVFNFYESIAFVRDGGDAFVKAFKENLAMYDVDIRCGTYITELAEISNSKVGRFVLNSGDEVTADACVFTNHPQDILKIMPENSFSKAFASRVTSFEASVGFFSLFATVKKGEVDPLPDAPIVSLFPDADLNNLLDPDYKGLPALVIIKSPDHSADCADKGICILEPSFAGHVSSWVGSHRGGRPDSYLKYKSKRVDEIQKHLSSVLPALHDALDYVDAGSMLTYKDYLNSPDGSAYGIKQKMRQFNLIGKLPLRNLYVAGQSSLLPGIIGGMMSSLVVGRMMLGKEQYGMLLGQRL